jgi:ribonuclease HII
MARQKFDRSLVPPSPDLTFEMSLWKQGVQFIAGVDEAGRGALAGPVAAGVVILPVDPQLTARLSGVRDSKEMSPATSFGQSNYTAWHAAARVGYASTRKLTSSDCAGDTSGRRRALEALSHTAPAPAGGLPRAAEHIHPPDQPGAR